MSSLSRVLAGPGVVPAIDVDITPPGPDEVLPPTEAYRLADGNTTRPDA